MESLLAFLFGSLFGVLLFVAPVAVLIKRSYRAALEAKAKTGAPFTPRNFAA